MKITLFVLLLHLSAMVSGQGNRGAQAETEAEFERLVLMHGAELMMPFLVMLEVAERKFDAGAQSAWERQKLQRKHEITLQILFSPNMIQCINRLRRPFREGAICEDAWFRESDPRHQEENEELCELSVLGAFSDCFSRGLLALPNNP